MVRYTIDDDVRTADEGAIEVTVELEAGEKRWCFFFTPEALAAVGDWVEGTQVRVHLGVPHMIVVSELSEGIIDRVLRTLDARGELREHTVPVQVDRA